MIWRSNMMFKDFLNDRDDLPKIKRFAILGNSKTLDFERKLDYLIRIAEKENWDQTDVHTGRKNSTIFYYIVHTFDRCYMQKKIYFDSNNENSFFNTGLMDNQGNEIFAHFTKSKFFEEGNPSSNYWYFKAFLKSNDKEFVRLCNDKPEPATYFEDYNELYFDPKLNIEINFDHIYDDNFERLPDSLKTLDKETARLVFDGFLSFRKKKIIRNNRIPVPQFYDNKISFLIPVKVFDKDIVVIAVEKINNNYIANTVLTMGMAYNCARLITKPESNWLLNE